MSKLPSKFCELSAVDLLKGYAAGEFSPVEVMTSVLTRAETINPEINAFYYLNAEEALQAAQQSEVRWRNGQPEGLLDGVPVSVKDSIAVKGLPMYRGSAAYMDSLPSAYDSPPASRLKESGAIVFAKTAMPDFGMFAAGVSSAYGITRNPWNLEYNTGGSSSGGAAAVAAGLGPVTVGSDVGGSVRIPASFCGLATLKPTQGRIPHLPASPIRSAGALARNTGDVALMMSVLSLPDSRDAGSLPYDNVAYHDLTNKLTNLSGMKIGVMMDTGFGMPLDSAVISAVMDAVAVLRDAGAQTEAMPPLINVDPMGIMETIFSVKSNVELLNLAEEKRQLVHPVVLEICSRASQLGASEYALALDKMEKIKSEVIEKTRHYDVVISPTMPVVNYPASSVAPDVSEPFKAVNFTSLFNQTGQPAATVCCGFDPQKLPIGLQIIGRRFEDLKVLQVANLYERLRGWDITWPQLQD